MSELFMVVALHAKKGKEDQLKRDLIAVVEPSRKEEGSLRYELFADQDDAGRFVFVEHWTSAEAQQKHHSRSAHIRSFNDHGAQNVERVEFVHRLSRLV